MGKPVEQIKEFAEKKFRALRENPDESAIKAYLAKMRRGVGKAPGTDPDLWGILIVSFVYRSPSLRSWHGFAFLESLHPCSSF